MSERDPAKFLFYVMSALAVIGLSFGFGIYSRGEKTALYTFLRDTKRSVVAALETARDESPTLFGLRPSHFLQPARQPGHGVTVNAPAGDNELVFMAGFFERSNELRLVRRDGSVVQRWPVRYSDIFPHSDHLKRPPATDWNVDIHGALILPDGAVVFNFEYSGLVKLDRCGAVVWQLARATHHSVEVAEGGGFWVPGQREHDEQADSPFPPFVPPYSEDTLLRISAAGQVEQEISVPGLFYANGLEALLSATGDSFTDEREWDHELVHLNKIEELDSTLAADFPAFEAGDLAVSLRKRNLLMVVDPRSERIKWWRIGPWIRQHDPEFRAGGVIVVFNNNVYRNDGDTAFAGSLQRGANIMEIDPVNNTTRVVYGAEPGQALYSTIRAKLEPTIRGGYLITEFEAGRVIETNAAGEIIWEYVNRYNENEVAELTEARIYAAGYFTVDNWSCPVARN